MNSPKFLYDNVILVVITGLSVILNFVSQLILAWYFGTSFERDAYFVAFSISAFVNILYSSSVVVTFLPAIINCRNKSEEYAGQLIGSVLLVNLLLIVVLFGIIFFTANTITHIIAPGYKPNEILFTSIQLKILLVGFAIQSFNSLMGVVYHVKRSFLIPSIQPILIAICSIGAVTMFHNSMGMTSLAWGYVVGCAFHCILLILKLNWNEILFSEFGDIIKGPTFKNIFWSAIPLLLAGLIVRSTTLFERYFASGLPEGSISYLGYASQLIAALITITSGSIATTIYPQLTEHWNNGNYDQLRNRLTQSINSIMLIAVPIIGFFLFFGKSSIKLLFERGAFSSADTDALTITLTLLMGYFLFVSFCNVLAKLLYSSGNTMMDSVIGVFQQIVYLVSGYYLSLFYSYKGLALALTLSTGVAAMSLFFFSKRLVPTYSIKRFLQCFVKLGVSATFPMGALYMLLETVGWSVDNWPGLFFVGILSFGLYLIMIARVFTIEEVTLIMNLIRKKININF